MRLAELVCRNVFGLNPGLEGAGSCLLGLSVSGYRRLLDKFCVCVDRFLQCGDKFIWVWGLRFWSGVTETGLVEGLLLAGLWLLSP